jgi:cytochrome c553
LAGQREFYLLEQLVWFAALNRIAPEMHRIVERPELDNPQALRDVAGYLAHKVHSTRTDHGDGHALEAGKRTYTQACAMCHGENGQGSDAEPIPAIGGQHYPYVLAQLKGFAAGHRSDAGPPVIDFTAGLSPEEQRGVADYVSRLTALTAEQR